MSSPSGGLTRAWGIEPDVLTIGKGLGTGLPFAVYGMTEPLARLIEAHSMPPSPADTGGVGLATGGTTYGTALVQAAARAALEQCLTQEGYARLEELGRKLAAGLETIFERRGLPWCSPQIGGRASWQLGPESPRTAAESRVMMDMFFIHTRRVFMANRGIWEAIDTAGPACSFSHEEADVDRYLEVAEEFVSVATTPA